MKARVRFFKPLFDLGFNFSVSCFNASRSWSTGPFLTPNDLTQSNHASSLFFWSIWSRRSIRSGNRLEVSVDKVRRSFEASLTRVRYLIVFNVTSISVVTLAERAMASISKSTWQLRVGISSPKMTRKGEVVFIGKGWTTLQIVAWLMQDDVMLAVKVSPPLKSPPSCTNNDRDTLHTCASRDIPAPPTPPLVN